MPTIHLMCWLGSHHRSRSWNEDVQVLRPNWSNSIKSSNKLSIIIIIISSFYFIFIVTANRTGSRNLAVVKLSGLSSFAVIIIAKTFKKKKNKFWPNITKGSINLIIARESPNCLQFVRTFPTALHAHHSTMLFTYSHAALTSLTFIN